MDFLVLLVKRELERRRQRLVAHDHTAGRVSGWRLIADAQQPPQLLPQQPGRSFRQIPLPHQLPLGPPHGNHPRFEDLVFPLQASRITA